MTALNTSSAGLVQTATKRYRLPGIEREGIAQLSLLETALWPLQGGQLPAGTFETAYQFVTPAGRKQATVTVRAALGLQPFDELVLWGLLGATLSWHEPDPVLLATPYWMLKHLGLATGGSQYAELRAALLRLAVASYQNTGFYNPETKEHEYAAFQFLSILLPTVGGFGETVDNERCWRIEWNAAFFRFCRAGGGNLLFDLDVYRALSPAARRLFLKLKDRFWRAKRVFLNVDELTSHGLGLASTRPLWKRKFDLTGCMRELLDHQIIELGRGQTDPKESFLKRGKGSYVVVFYEGAYFRQPAAQRAQSPQDAFTADPLYQPLRQLGVDGPGVRRLLQHHGRGKVQRWLRITDAALHEKPQGFPGFHASPAAFLMDGVLKDRTPPDWFHAHEKRQEQQQWQQARSTAEPQLQAVYQQERASALQSYLMSAEGRIYYRQAIDPLRALYRVTEPHRAQEAAHQAAIARIEKLYFRFPEYDHWAATYDSSAHAKPA